MDQIEHSDLIHDLGYWIAAEACRFQRRIVEAFRYDFTVAVNLSGKQFDDPALITRLGKIMQETGVKPSQIEFEVTESLLLGSPEMASRALHELKQTGAGLLIDDFGTGYSSFSYLHRLPFDKLKIDRAFVSSMINGKKSKQIVRSLINLSRDLEMEVVAEGIETRGELDLLREYRAHYGQGYYFSRPISEADLVKLIQPRKAG